MYFTRKNWKDENNVHHAGGKWVAEKGDNTAGDKCLVTYFITEFPDDFGDKDLFEVFKEFGLVIEVVIHFRRDKHGKRFVFVRFGNVSDGRILGVNIGCFRASYERQGYFTPYACVDQNK